MFSDKASIQDFLVEGQNGVTNVTKNENDTLRFICRVDSNPASLIEIKLNGYVKRSKHGAYQLTYEKVRLACDDTGFYSCIGKNDYNRVDESSRNITLNVRCK